jgi:hypothetical protein
MPGLEGLSAAEQEKIRAVMAAAGDQGMPAPMQAPKPTPQPQPQQPAASTFGFGKFTSMVKTQTDNIVKQANEAVQQATG